MKFLIIFASFLIAANGQIVMTGQCQDPDVVQDFDIPAYAGLWYETFRYEHVNQFSGDCVTARYTLNDEGVVEVQNAMVFNGTSFVIDGSVAPAEGSNGEAKLVVNFPTADNIFSSYWVLATNYNSYALVYSCTNLPNNNKRVSSWILSRTQALTPQDVLALDTTIEASSELYWNVYRQTSQSETSCNTSRSLLSMLKRQ